MHLSEYRAKHPGLIGFLIITVFSAVAYGLLLRRPLFLCEYPLFYDMNADLSMLDWLRSYWPGSGGWYRPTAFHTYFQILTQWISWHDFFTIRIIAIGHMVLLGGAVMKLGLTLWPERPRIAIAGGVIAAVHPIQAMQVVDLIHFDTIYQTALVLLAVWFLSPPRGSFPRRVGSVAWALFLWFVALTSKEPSVALPGWLTVLGVVAWWPRHRAPALLELSREKWVMAAVITLSAVALLAFRLNAVGFGDEGAYRMSPNPGQIFANATAGGFWLLHLFVVDSPSWSGYSANLNGWVSTVFGALSIALMAFSLWRLVRGEAMEKRRLSLLLVWSVVFFLIPIYSGGRPWHFGPSLVGVALLLGYGLDGLLQLIKNPQWQQGTLGALGLVFALLCAENMLDDRRFRHNPQEWVLAAVQAPPVAPDELEPDATVVYEVGDEAAKWAVGMGHLWTFVYLRPELEELPVPRLSDITLSQAEILLQRPHLHFFVLQTGPEPSWSDRPEILREYLRALTAQGRKRTIQIDFSAPGPELAVVEGLGGPESWGSWNVGHTTRLRLRAPEGLAKAENWQFSIAGSPYIPAEREPFTITIEVNGNEVLHRRVQHPEDATLLHFEWKQAGPLLDAQDQFEITVRYSSIVSPRELGLSSEQRQFALGLRTLEVKPAGE